MSKHLNTPIRSCCCCVAYLMLYFLITDGSFNQSKDIQVIYYGLQGLEAFTSYHDTVLRTLCKLVRYERHEANDVLYSTGELSTCWYVLLSGSVFIDGSMFLPPNSFGQRTAGSARRPNECFVLEPSEMIVIDYPETPVTNINYNSRNFRLDHYEEDMLGLTNNMMQPHNRDSQSSDTSSAYSGSDTVSSIHSTETEELIDLSGLIESVVDSDEEEISESRKLPSLAVRDKVRECLEKDPSDRTDEEIDILLDFTQHLKAFTNTTLSIRRALCSVMVFAIVEKIGTVVMNDGEELDSWSVIINGQVEVEHSDGRVEYQRCGDSFGILPTMDKLYHEGVMRTRSPDCQFVCVTQTDYFRILHQGEENIKRHEDENGKVVLVTESRTVNVGNDVIKGFIVIRGTDEELLMQLIKSNAPIDRTYVEDFLLTSRTFIKDPLRITNQLLNWFKNSAFKNRVARIVLQWVSNHFTDFETDSMMMNFLEKFEELLQKENMSEQLSYINYACTKKAKVRCVTLTRSDRDEPLNFTIFGGYERACGIFITAVEQNSKAEDIGLKRGDQILSVNGQHFQHISNEKAMEILCGSTHLSITVKANLSELKELLEMPEDLLATRGSRFKQATSASKMPFDDRLRTSPFHMAGSHLSPGKKSSSSVGFMTLGPKKRFQKALIKMNFLPRSNNVLDTTDDSSLLHNEHRELSSHYHSLSQPDLVSMSYDDPAVVEYPEYVLKVYRSDQAFKYLLTHKETTAHEVVMLTLREFGMTDPSSNYSLCEVSVTDSRIIKQKRLPDQLQNLAELQELCCRYYLKTNGITETLVTDEIAADMVRESTVGFLQLNPSEIALQLTVSDYNIFRQIEPVEYIDDLFELHSSYGAPALSQFSQLVNKEMFWVVTEICSEPSLVKRSRIIKQFIKLARHCKEFKNFNSLFAIISGLGHASVNRLRMSWEKLPRKYETLFSDLQDLMDPSRNMSKYRQLISQAQCSPPLIPFYPVVKKDLTFINLGNDSTIEGLINFEKMRMVSKEIRKLTNMSSSNFDFVSMLDQGIQPTPAIVTSNAINQTITTAKRRKKTSTALNPKKMFEEAQMVRRVKTYLSKMKVITDEEKLHELSLQCEGSANSGLTIPSGMGPLRKHNPSPTLSTASSTSSTSEGRRTAPKFGTASPQTVRKLLSLSEQCKTRARPNQPLRQPFPPHVIHPRLPHAAARRPPPQASAHERSYSDTAAAHPHYHPLPFASVRLNAESSSVTSLSNLPIRRNAAGSVPGMPSDSSSVTQPDSHSNSSGESMISSSTVPTPNMFQSRHMQHVQRITSGVCLGITNSNCMVKPTADNQPSGNSLPLNRSFSHEGITSFYHLNPEDDDDNTQVSAV